MTKKNAVKVKEGCKINFLFQRINNKRKSNLEEKSFKQTVGCWSTIHKRHILVAVRTKKKARQVTVQSEYNVNKKKAI